MIAFSVFASKICIFIRLNCKYTVSSSRPINIPLILAVRLILFSKVKVICVIAPKGSITSILALNDDSYSLGIIFRSSGLKPIIKSPLGLDCNNICACSSVMSNFATSETNVCNEPVFLSL